MGTSAVTAGAKVSKSIDRTANKLNNKLSPAIDRARRKSRQMRKSMGSLGQRMDIFNAKMNRKFAGTLGPIRQIASQIPIIGGALGNITPIALGVTAAIFGIVKAVQGLSAATRRYLEFEAGMKSVQRITLASAKDMKILEDAALKAGEASIFTVSQAADAEKFLAQAGLEVNEVIGALPGTLQLAAAANIDLGRAADIATDIMSAQGLAVFDLTRINDTLVKGANLATTTVQGLGAGFSTLGSEAQRVNLDIETITGSLGILAKAGQKNELGGTLLRNMLADVKRSKFRKAAQKVGIDIGRFIDEGTGKFTDFTGLISSIGKLDDVALNTLMEGGFAQASRGKRALGSLVLQSDLLVENIQKIRESGGVAEQAAGVAFQGLSGKLARFKSIIDVTLVKFMKDSGLASVFEDIVEMATDILPPLIRTIGLIITPISAVLKALFVFSKAQTKVIGGVFKIAINTASAIIDIFKTFLNPFNTVIERVLGGIGKIFGAASDVKDGPMSGWLGAMQNFADGWDDWASGILKDLNPLLEVMDIMLNIFLFNLPKASEAFMKKLDKLAENSLLFKIVRFFVNSENDAADEKQSAAASKVTSSNANKARFFGFTGQAAIGNTLDEKKEKKSVIDPNEQSGVTNFLERMFPGLHDPKGSIVPQASTPAGDIAKAGNISNSTNSKVITIGEVKAEVIVQGSANSEETGLVIVEKINDAIAGQLRDVLAEGF
jgi:TP901 family phage tail tape measure protein